MANRKADNPHLYLASNSPRRRELMTLGGWSYATLTTSVDETPLPGEDGAEYVVRLAKSKAESAASRVAEKGVIIAADTSVIDGAGSAGARILGKPADRGEAADILRSLRGHSHLVHTALAILDRRSGNLLQDLCTTIVPMRDYSDDEIDAYIASGDPMDKAGAYAIQNVHFHPVEQLDGCYANVMGLPLCHLTRSLHQLAIHPLADVPSACQTALGYDCPVFCQVLKEKIRDYTCG